MAVVTQDMQIVSAKCTRKAIMESLNTMGNIHNTSCMLCTSNMQVDLCMLMYIHATVDIYIYRSRCHGNVRINDDSKSHRIIPLAWRVMINPIYVRGGQSARDDKSHIRTWRAECA